MELPYTIGRTQILGRTLHASQAPEHLVGPWVAPVGHHAGVLGRVKTSLAPLGAARPLTLPARSHLVLHLSERRWTDSIPRRLKSQKSTRNERRRAAAVPGATVAPLVVVLGLVRLEKAINSRKLLLADPTLAAQVADVVLIDYTLHDE